MSTNLKRMKSESNYERPEALEAGTYPGRTVWMIGLGLQEQPDYQGQAKAPKQEAHIKYELSDEFLLDEEGEEDITKPRFVQETITLNPLNSDLAKSTQRYGVLDPDMEADGDFLSLVGKPCMINLTHTEDKKKKGIFYNNVKNVGSMRAKDAAKLPELVNEAKTFDFYDPDIVVFKSLPEWLQDICKKSLDFPGSELENLLESGAIEDDEPVKEQTSNEEETDW